MSQQILAIDQSTSATKAVLFDVENWRVLDKASLEHRQIYPQPGWVEHDAEEIWQNTLHVLGQVLARAEPMCLSITNQRETVVVFDRATGKPLHKAIVWQCRRGEDICAELKSAGHEELVARKTGLKIDPYFSASKLTWLMRNRPDLGRKLESGEAMIGTIDAYLIYRLTQGRTAATDHTNASRTLLLDINRLAWDRELCDLFKVPTQGLPELRESTADYGTAIMFGREMPIRGVMGDSQASLFGHRCFSPGMTKVTLGSGSSVLLNIGPEIRAPADGAVATIGWTDRGAATYAFEGIINYSAATIAWLRDQLGLLKSPDEAEAAAMAVPDNGGVYFVPAFAGLSAPYWSASSRAAIVGMSAHSARNHVIRAALESIGYQIRDVLDTMAGRAGVPLREIRADGGATRNKFLMQFVADITGRKILTSAVPEVSPLGAAMAGAIGMRLYHSLDALASASEENTIRYMPRMPPAQAATLHDGWKRAVRQVLAGATTA